MPTISPPDRRDVLRAALRIGAGGALAGWMPAWAQRVSAGVVAPVPTVSGDDITLMIARQTMTIDGRRMRAIGINGTVPGPLIRLREGQVARLRVVNGLDVDSSIHWHGLLVPADQDGVPGISFPGIAPGATYVAEFSGQAGGDILVSQPFGAAGTGGAVRPDRDRSRRPRPGRL